MIGCRPKLRCRISVKGVFRMSIAKKSAAAGLLLFGIAATRLTAQAIPAQDTDEDDNAHYKAVDCDHGKAHSILSHSAGYAWWIATWTINRQNNTISGMAFSMNADTGPSQLPPDKEATMTAHGTLTLAIDPVTDPVTGKPATKVTITGVTIKDATITSPGGNLYYIFDAKSNALVLDTSRTTPQAIAAVKARVMAENMGAYYSSKGTFSDPSPSNILQSARDALAHFNDPKTGCGCLPGPAAVSQVYGKTVVTIASARP